MSAPHPRFPILWHLSHLPAKIVAHTALFARLGAIPAAGYSASKKPDRGGPKLETPAASSNRPCLHSSDGCDVIRQSSGCSVGCTVLPDVISFKTTIKQLAFEAYDNLPSKLTTGKETRV